MTYIVEGTKNYSVLETLININKRSTYWTKIFEGIKYTQLHKQDFFF